jgi:hypothetical protein
MEKDHDIAANRGVDVDAGESCTGWIRGDVEMAVGATY